MSELKYLNAKWDECSHRDEIALAHQLMEKLAKAIRTLHREGDQFIIDCAWAEPIKVVIDGKRYRAHGSLSFHAGADLEGDVKQWETVESSTDVTCSEQPASES